jgi:phage/plasmid-associated DNA primase
MKFDEGLIKTLTGGGGNKMSARDVRTKQETFISRAKLLCQTNYVPLFNAEDVAMLSRVVEIHFRVSIPKDEQDPNLARNLLDKDGGERSGILNWLIEGARAWYKEGLLDDPNIGRTVSKFFQRASFDNFMEVYCLVNDENGTSRSDDLLNAYITYQQKLRDSAPPMNPKKLSAVIVAAGEDTAHGFSKYVHDNLTYWKGIQLNEAGKALLPAAPVKAAPPRTVDSGTTSAMTEEEKREAELQLQAGE